MFLKNKHYFIIYDVTHHTLTSVNAPFPLSLSSVVYSVKSLTKVYWAIT